MISLQLTQRLWYLGSIQKELRTYGTVSYKDRGAMYNSYLMDIGDGYAVLGSIPEYDLTDWIENINAVISGKTAGKNEKNNTEKNITEESNTEGKTLRYAVLFGTSRDRETAKSLLAVFPQITFIGDMNTFTRLEGFSEQSYRRVVVRLKRTIILGDRKLYFHPIQEKYTTPSLYVVDPEDRILFTADAFGSDLADERILSGRIDPQIYLTAAEKYYRDIFGGQRTRTMTEAVRLAENNGIRMICPSEGAVADADLSSLYELYRDETGITGKKDTGIPAAALLYTPGGHTEELAACISAGIRDAGEIKVNLCSLAQMNTEEAVRIAEESDAYVIGTPSVRGDAAKAVWDILTSLRKDTSAGKQAAVFSSYHAVTDAVDNVKLRLQMIGCELYMRDLEVQGAPDAAALKNAYDFGYGIGCAILKKPNDRQPALVKCLVCGEIFDASLGICPVCGVGLEQCVPADEEEVSYHRDTENTYVIAGGGIAGLSAADAVRRRDKTGRIVMITAEESLPINRPMLTKDVSAAAEDPETLLVHPAEWYKERNIEVLTGMTVTAIDPREKTVQYSRQEAASLQTQGEVYTIRYDRLIYAAGAECFIPPFKGRDKENVLTIRHLTDSTRLGELLEKAKTAVVIGGGVLGLEAANEIMRAGVKVTVLEAAPQIIGRQADRESASILKNIMEDLGVGCYEGVSIEEIEGDRIAEGVKLADGRVFPADFVVVSCGNRANTAALKNAGAAVERAVVVDERMRTSLPDIYACGDCCQFEGLNYQLWQEASSQGNIAGANAAGDDLIYTNQMLGLSLEGFGTSLFALGDPGKDPELKYKTIVTTDTVANRHERYWYRGGALQGCVVIGAAEKIPALTTAVRTHQRYEDR